MTFDEFLLAKGNRQLVDILRSKDWVTIKLLKSEYIKALREYYFVGGMPEAVGKFIETNDAVKVREIQKNILLYLPKRYIKTCAYFGIQSYQYGVAIHALTIGERE